MIAQRLCRTWMILNKLCRMLTQDPALYAIMKCEEHAGEMLKSLLLDVVTLGG